MKELEDEFVGFFSGVAKKYGVGDLAANIVAILYLEPGEVSMDYLSERTGYSLPSISNTMKFLEASGIAERVRKPGTNKLFFYMEKNIARLNIRKLQSIRQNAIAPAKETLPAIIKKYTSRVKDEKSKQKLRIIEDYYAQMLKADEIIGHIISDLEGLCSKHR